MKKAFLFFFLLGGTLILHSQSLYYGRNYLSPAAAGAMKYGLYGYDNPAGAGLNKANDLYAMWSTRGRGWQDGGMFGGFFGTSGLGFGAVYEKNNGKSATSYMLSSGSQSGALATGIGFGWTTGDAEAFGKSNLWSFGFLYRPAAFISAGAVAFFPSKGEREAAFELAVRPFGNELVSVFGDYVVKDTRLPNEPKYSAGIAVEAYPGVRITGRYFDNKQLTAGVQLELGNFGLSSQGYFNKDSKHEFSTYGVRLGAYDRNLIDNLKSGGNWYQINLAQGVKYTKFKFLDNSQTLLALLNNIDAAIHDRTVSGIVMNLSEVNVSRENAWEIREKLKEAKAAGKKITVYIERGGLDIYLLASLADVVYIDPLGMLTFEGYMMGRTFVKGTLEKLGIGYDEWRFFKYKSAAESYSRDKMSEADREQRQELVNDWYDLAKDQLSSSGRVTGTAFDSLVNNQFLLTAQQALAQGLADKIGRWDDVTKEISDNKGRIIGAAQLVPNKLPEDNNWSVKPKVAVIYAIGACAMDEGINARSLVNDVNAAVNNEEVKAIVLRVDSPGGDALASDIIAEALKKAKGKKPVIISQGAVAASGGYWLSMYGDTIVAAPGTITGSIGVIGGWFYNKSLKESMGFSTDLVKKGNHADMGFGFTMPLLGLGLPDRNLTPAEYTVMETMIKGMYKDFVSRVASGRNASFDKIAEIAQGRVWSGVDGLKNGLVDVLGGLETAINIAASKANLKKGSYTLAEYPQGGFLDFGQFMPRLVSFNVEDDPLYQQMKLRYQLNGKPAAMLPLDWYDVYAK